MKNKLLKVSEVAKLFQVRKSTIYKWVHYGYIPHIKLGTSVRFDEDSLKEWIKKKETKGRKQLIDFG